MEKSNYFLEPCRFRIGHQAPQNYKWHFQKALLLKKQIMNSGFILAEINTIKLSFSTCYLFYRHKQERANGSFMIQTKLIAIKSLINQYELFICIFND